MKLEKIKNSSVVEAIGYDEKRKVMKVQYKGTATYEYFNVLKKEFNSIMKAENIGNQIRLAINTSRPVKSYRKV